MKLFRKKFVQLSFLLLTGVTFLNMSFFLAEISAFHDLYSKVPIENIAKLLSASMTEEEQDVSETSENASAKVIDLLSEHANHLQLEASEISLILKSLGSKNSPTSGYYTIVTPPPDFC